MISICSVRNGLWIVTESEQRIVAQRSHPFFHFGAILSASSQLKRTIELPANFMCMCVFAWWSCDRCRRRQRCWCTQMCSMQFDASKQIVRISEIDVQQHRQTNTRLVFIPWIFTSAAILQLVYFCAFAPIAFACVHNLQSTAHSQCCYQLKMSDHTMLSALHWVVILNA